MRHPFTQCCFLLAGLVLLATGRSPEATGLTLGNPLPEPKLQSLGARKVNAPYFNGSVRFSETAVFWFGRVTPMENSVDVRVGYNDDYLYINVATFDRRLWYDTSPAPGDLTNWDSVTLYLDTDGNVGAIRDTSTFRFDAQLVWWEPRQNYQAAYQGNGSSFVQATIPFTTTSGWRGDAPNNQVDDRGWVLTYYIPFSSLGLGRPAQGTTWGLALVLHDRDDSQGTSIPGQIWPDSMQSQQPATWGQLSFGMPAFAPPPAAVQGTSVIRHGLNGVTVADADVGGSSVCGQEAAPGFFPTWGGLNYAGKGFLNIQNQSDISDWPCFARYYVTFPLDILPSDKMILSATLTLHLFGSAGEGWNPGPKPSLIQVLTVGEDWSEDTIAWNTAPLAHENIGSTWVNPVSAYAGMPGIPYKWDVSRAVADAYAAGQPLRLALYESDSAYHSGKYFYTSETCSSNPEGCPTLEITWGRPLAHVVKSAIPSAGNQGDAVTYTLGFLGTGNTLTLTDTLPSGVSAPRDWVLEGTSETPAYNSSQHRLTWSGNPGVAQEVTIRYTVTIDSNVSQALANTVRLSDAGGDVSTATAVAIANPYQAYFPVVRRGN